MAEPKLKDILKNISDGNSTEFEVGWGKNGKPFIKKSSNREDYQDGLIEIGRMEQAGVSAPPAPVQNNSINSQFIPRTRLSMQEAVKRFIDGQRKSCTEKTLGSKATALVEFKSYIKANKALYAITRQDLDNFRLHQLLINDLRTVYNKFIYITQFFDEMIRVGLYKMENPAKGLVKYSKKQKNKDTENNKHLPFDEDELKAVFDVKTYPVHNPHLFWGVMLSYYTGLRVNEVAQLLIVNINRNENLIKVSSSGQEQSLKTSNAKRTIPIHQDIIEAGFYNYIDDLRELKQFHLFPNLNKTKNNFGGRLSSDFSRHLIKIGIKRPRKSFHSLRETFVEMMDLAKVDIVSSSYFIGHAIDTTLYQHYLIKNPNITTPENLKNICLPAVVPRVATIKYKAKMFNELLIGKIETKNNIAKK